MAEISANKPAFYDSAKPTVSSTHLAMNYQQKPNKSPKSARQDVSGVSHQLSDKHKYFKRRDTPMTVKYTGSDSKNSFKPELNGQMLEEEEEEEETESQ